MNGKTTTAAAILLLAFFVFVCAQAQTISVTPSGGDYPVLQQALDTASPGDVIMIAAGTYPGGVMVNVPVTLSGEDGAMVGTNADTVALYVNADDVVIRNLACTASGAGIIANETDGLQADRCRVISDDTGILLTGCSNCAITSTEVTAKRTGIETTFCNATTISKSRVSAGSVGIAMKDSSDAAVEEVRILGAEIGILMENSGGCRLDAVTFAGIGDAVLGIGITDCTITGSVFTDVTQYVQFYAASGCSIEAPSLQGPAFFAADIFSDTGYRWGPYSVTGRDFALLYDSYETPEGYLLFGDAMNITFIAAAESPEPPSVTITADLPANTTGIAENTYGLYRTDGTAPVLVAVPEVSDSGPEILRMNVTEPGHIALMARAEAEETPYYYIFLWVVVALGVLLLLVLWRRR
ncbi:right-handed parallel beta-helix repeat-containing protein [Methanogenium sp. S4BF]|uniref:right-handed parallel beta-helix repeat-containing protein n=1 Tax=Methanogenium sp. S4BF TaxID=1789226 RepID=UPI0024161713|nr:NosD domain-containing protein [Methanogenium sp. S4BF]WFN34630.1 right-handed parallel beta-helix repeat-containing protein [Methanogenium sp. S4BF]